MSVQYTKKSYLYKYFPIHNFWVLQKFPPILLFRPIRLLILQKFSHLYFYSDLYFYSFLRKLPTYIFIQTRRLFGTLEPTSNFCLCLKLTICRNSKLVLFPICIGLCKFLITRVWSQKWNMSIHLFEKFLHITFLCIGAFVRDVLIRIKPMG